MVAVNDFVPGLLADELEDTPGDRFHGWPPNF